MLKSWKWHAPEAKSNAEILILWENIPRNQFSAEIRIFSQNIKVSASLFALGA